MEPSYASKLGLGICKTNIDIKIFNGNKPDIYKIVMTLF